MNRSFLFLAVLCLCQSATARAELPQEMYDQLRREAPEVYKIKITDVRELKPPLHPDGRSYVAAAEIQSIIRSKAGSKAGQRISFAYNDISDQAWARGFSGPADPPPLFRGWAGTVYLKPSDDFAGAAPWQPAAFGKSFDRTGTRPFQRRLGRRR